jgi:hypothetical protein
MSWFEWVLMIIAMLAWYAAGFLGGYNYASEKELKAKLRKTT